MRRDRVRHPLGIWPSSAAPNAAQGSRRGGEPVTAAVARVIDASSRPADLVATTVGCLPTVIESAAAAGRRVLGLIVGSGPALHRRGDPAALSPSGDSGCIDVVSDAVIKYGEPA